MRVTASVMGMPELAGGAGQIETKAPDLASLWDQVSDGAEEPGLMAFVNGSPVERDWGKVELEDGDEVLFMIRVSGG